MLKTLISCNKKLVLNKTRQKQVLILLPLARENLTSYLSPLLGQYGIRNNEFLENFYTKFNVLTNDIFAQDINIENVEVGLSEEEIIIPVNLDVYKAGKYDFSVIYPHVGTLFRSYCKKKRRFYKRYFFYRNYKRLLQLSVFKHFVFKFSFESINLNENFMTTKALENTYTVIRNSLHRK